MTQIEFQEKLKALCEEAGVTLQCQLGIMAVPNQVNYDPSIATVAPVVEPTPAVVPPVEAVPVVAEEAPVPSEQAPAAIESIGVVPESPAGGSGNQASA